MLWTLPSSDLVDTYLDEDEPGHVCAPSDDEDDDDHSDDTEADHV